MQQQSQNQGTQLQKQDSQRQQKMNSAQPDKRQKIDQTSSL